MQMTMQQFCWLTNDMRRIPQKEVIHAQLTSFQNGSRTVLSQGQTTMVKFIGCYISFSSSTGEEVVIRINEMLLSLTFSNAALT